MKPVLVIPGTDLVVCFDATREDVTMRQHFVHQCGWPPARLRVVAHYAWFCAEVSLWREGVLLGKEYLGCCCYKTEDEFWTTYKGDYFADMVRELVREHAGDAAKEWVESWHASFRTQEPTPQI